jgi:hypothetical protein
MKKPKDWMPAGQKYTTMLQSTTKVRTRVAVQWDSLCCVCPRKKSSGSHNFEESSTRKKRELFF